MNITPHFTFEELIATNHQELLDKNRTVAQQNATAMWHLALFAEQVRAILNVPIRITSGFRCEALNNAVGGSKTSQHTLFQALDIIPIGIDIGMFACEPTPKTFIPRFVYPPNANMLVGIMGNNLLQNLLSFF